MPAGGRLISGETRCSGTVSERIAASYRQVPVSAGGDLAAASDRRFARQRKSSAQQFGGAHSSAATWLNLIDGEPAVADPNGKATVLRSPQFAGFDVRLRSINGVRAPDDKSIVADREVRARPRLVRADLTREPFGGSRRVEVAVAAPQRAGQRRCGLVLRDGNDLAI